MKEYRWAPTIYAVQYMADETPPPTPGYGQWKPIYSVWVPPATDTKEGHMETMMERSKPNDR